MPFLVWVSIITPIRKKSIQFQLYNPLKNLEYILWPDLINNSLTSHASNNNCPISLENLLQIIKSYDNRIKAIIYCQRHCTSNIYNRLKDLRFVIVDIIKDILLRRKTKVRQIVGKYKALHFVLELEYRLLSVVFKYINNPERIILQERPKKPNERRRSERKSKKESRLVVNSQPVLGPANFAEETVDFSEVQSYSLNSESMPPKTSSSRKDKCPK